MNLKTLQYLAQLKRNVFQENAVDEDPFMDELEKVSENLYKDKVINLTNYKQDNPTK